MQFEDELQVLGTIARRLQLLEKGAHDLYWDIDALTQKMMKEEIDKQKATEQAKEKEEKAKTSEKVVDAEKPKRVEVEKKA